MGKPFRRLERWARSCRAKVNECPVIVLGNQKAGTTAIAALLAEYAGATVTLDFSPYLTPGFLLQTQGKPDGLSRMLDRFELEFSRDIVKEPHLTFFYPELVDRFPGARFVMIVRDPRDNLRSILDRLGIRGDLTSAPPDAFDVPHTWSLVMNGSWLGFDGTDYIEQLSQRWNCAAAIAIRNRDNLRLIRYEDFQKDKEGCITETASALGLARRGEIREKLHIPYQRAGNRSVRWEDFFGSHNLDRIQTVCAERMQRLGYDVV